MRFFFLALLSLIPFSYTNTIASTGYITPTGGINMEDQEYQYHMNVKILEDIEGSNKFALYFYFNYNNLVGTTNNTTLTSSVLIITGIRIIYQNSIVAQDSESEDETSWMYFERYLYFKKGYELEITFTGLKLLNSCDAQKLYVYLLFVFDGIIVIQKRVLLPFYPYSFITSNNEKTQITTRFTSLFGY